MSFVRKLAIMNLLTALSLCPILSHGEEYDDDLEEDLADFYGDEEFVSIATGTKKAIHKAPSVATVITSEDIKSMGAVSLNEVLERAPNVHVSISNLSRHDPVFSVRGIQTGFNPQILVLLNGTEFKNSGNGGLPFIFYLPVNNIDRIEIIRGPGSAVYGADAFSGVINIITNQQFSNSTEFGGKSGSFGSSEYWLRSAYKIDDFAFSLALEKFDTNGDDSRLVESDLQSGLDQIFSTAASQAPGHLPTDRDILNVIFDVKFDNFQLEHWHWKQSDGGLGPGGAQTLDYVGYQDVDLNRTKFSFGDTFLGDSNYSLDYSRLVFDQDTSFSLLPAGTVVPIGSDGNLDFVAPAGFSLFTEGVIGEPGGRHTDSRFNLVVNYRKLEKHKLRLGLGWLEQEVDSREYKNFGPGIINGSEPVIDGTLTDVSDTPFVYLPDVRREARYFSVQDEWSLGNDWELTFGVRYDDYSDFGSSVNPRAALVWQTRYNLTTKLLYGKAFRPPSFVELKLQNNPVSLGNRNLKQEEIDTIEVAFDYRMNATTSFALSIFHYQAENIIDVVADVGEPTRTYQNTRNQEGDGFEFLVDWKVNSNFKIHYNYSYQSIEAKSKLVPNSAFEDVPDVPGNSMYLDLRYELNDYWYLTSQYFSISDRKRISSDLRENIADYSNTNLNLIFYPREGWEINLSAKNLFDNSQREPSDGAILNDYLLEQRAIWFGLKVQL